jgi:hypothetical protein
VPCCIVNCTCISTLPKKALLNSILNHLACRKPQGNRHLVVTHIVFRTAQIVFRTYLVDGCSVSFANGCLRKRTPTPFFLCFPFFLLRSVLFMFLHSGITFGAGCPQLPPHQLGFVRSSGKESHGPLHIYIVTNKYQFALRGNTVKHDGHIYLGSHDSAPLNYQTQAAVSRCRVADRIHAMAWL